MPKWSTPVINGKELPEGFGVEFGYDDGNTLDVLDNSFVLAAPVMRGWITRRNRRGEYERYYEIPSGALVMCWDDRGRAWEYLDGTLEIFEDKIQDEEDE